MFQVCGDFNSEPSSAVYELVSTQGVSRDHSDLQNDPNHVLPDALELTHNIQLQVIHPSFNASSFTHCCSSNIDPSDLQNDPNHVLPDALELTHNIQLQVIYPLLQFSAHHCTPSWS